MKFTPVSSSRGFTLIELLVVIAIIGILSAVMLASLALGRLKAADSTIKSNLHTIRSQMELYYSNNATYGPTFASQPSATYVVSGTSVFATDPTIRNALVGALAQGGPGYWAVGMGGSTYAVEIPLKSQSGYWCIDSGGTPSLETTGGGLGGGASAAARCP